MTTNGFVSVIKGYGGYDLEKGKKYQFTFLNKNVKKYFVETSTG